MRKFKLYNKLTTDDIDIKASIPGIGRIAMDKIITAWYESGNAPPKIRKNIPKKDEDLLKKQLSDCIKIKGGEISNTSRIIHLGMIYINQTKEGKKKFLSILAKDFDINLENLSKIIRQFQEAKNDKEKILYELELRDALVPPRVTLLRQFITLPDGFIFLKDMRRELLPLISSFPRLKKLDKDIKNLLITYFDINLLDLKEITWNSPAILLEKLMEYEAVHEIHSWKNLKYRLHTNHRIFAFTHYKMPNEPLVFLEVALVDGLANNISDIVDEDSPEIDSKKADTAIFYSISSTQKGLAGISFGNFLIKRVVKVLSEELPNIKHFATLSPIPKFKEWFNNNFTNNDIGLFTENEIKIILRLSKKSDVKEGLIKILNSKWYNNQITSEAIKRPLMRLCTHYLLNAKKKQKVYDPVANFHLTNGAKIQQINWLANISPKGLKQSAGIMVNYKYELSKIATNHELFLSKGKIVASRDVRSWLSKPKSWLKK